MPPKTAARRSANKEDIEDDAGDTRVYKAVAAGESVAEVRRLIELVARGSPQRRAAAADAEGEHRRHPETPLQAAHRLRRGHLVGLLLESGADPQKLFDNPNTSALALCIAYGQPNSLRALLRSGRHNAAARLAYTPGGHVGGCAPPPPSASGPSRPFFPPNPPAHCTAAHLCIRPPRLSTHPQDDAPPPDLRCLEVLVQEGGGGGVLDARDDKGRAPIHFVLPGRPGHGAALARLVELGADVNARDDGGCTPLFSCAFRGDLAAVRLLLERGASADVVSHAGSTPLSLACSQPSAAPAAEEDDARRQIITQLLDRSSAQTRRATLSATGSSAVDFILDVGGRPLPPWAKRAIAELLVSGAPVLRRNARAALPIAVRYGLPRAARREAEVAARQAAPMPWRAHEAVVGLALDAREAREAEAAVEAAARRVEALEEELREIGAGTESDSCGSEEELLSE